MGNNFIYYKTRGKKLISKTPLGGIIKILPFYQRKIKFNRIEKKIENEILSKYFKKLKIISGPFKNLKYINKSYCSTLLPKLIGSYEEPIQKWIENIDFKKYDLIVDIGSAEGYYAVGLAKKFPNKKVLAYDIDEKARKLCKQLSKINNVTNLEIKKEANYKEMDKFPKRTFILCDIEGAEKYLLNPIKSKNLRNMDIIVESHDLLSKNVGEILIKRFKKTHKIEIVYDYDYREIPIQLERLSYEQKKVLINEKRGDKHMRWIKMESLNK